MAELDPPLYSYNIEPLSTIEVTYSLFPILTYLQAKLSLKYQLMI